MKIEAQARTAARRRLGRAAGALAGCALTACHSAVLSPRGPVSRSETTILIDSLVIMLVIVVPTIAATLAIAWWYRASNSRARYLPGWAFSGRVELVVWFIPLMVIILLGGVCWIGAHQLDPARPLESRAAPVDIEVVSLDWKWLFIYPRQGVASVNELVVPVDVPLHFSLTSASVLNAFFIPQLGSMIYTMNGMVTQLYLRADAPGSYRGLSSHYSGAGFSDMHFEVRALPAGQFAGWLEAARRGGARLDAQSYAALSRQSSAVPAATYAQVDPRLFADIASQRLAAGPGPELHRGGARQASAGAR